MKKWGLVSVLVFVLSLVFGSAVLAQRGELEIDGLIIDQTQTRIGQEFYQNFVTFWEAPSGIKDYNILVTEMASPFWGSLIGIEVNDVVVYRGLLRPRSEEIEEAAKKEVESIKEYLYSLEEYKKEASGKDMTGNGIY